MEMKEEKDTCKAPVNWKDEDNGKVWGHYTNEGRGSQTEHTQLKITTAYVSNIHIAMHTDDHEIILKPQHIYILYW